MEYLVLVPGGPIATEEAQVVTYDSVMEPTLEVPRPQLTATDRCDRCGAQAYHLAELPSGLELLFCNHHFEENQEGLIAAEARVTSDEVPG